MKEIFFNILTRTSGRPKFFEKCCQSIDSQNYKKFKHIICTDDKESIKYVKNMRHDPLYINKIEKNTLIKSAMMSSPYNLYFNQMYNHVDEGFIIFLDDDDEFTSVQSLREIANNISNLPDPENSLIFWQVGFPNGIVIPNNFENQFLRPRNVSGIGYCFHSKYLFAAMWDEFKECDYRVAHKLSLVVPTHMTISATLTRIQRSSGMGGFGTLDDLAE
jgi:hypothetical protein